MGLQAAAAYLGEAGFEHPVELDRRILQVLFRKSGLVSIGDWAVTPVVGSLEAQIGSGSGVLIGEETVQQGAYFAWSDTPSTLPWPSPSGSPRVDTLLVRVQDPQYGTISGDPGASWEIVSGVPSSSPFALPDSEFEPGGGFYKPGAWFRIGDWDVAPGDIELNGLGWHPNTRWAGKGRTIYCLSTDRPTDPKPGDIIYEVDTSLEWTWRTRGGDHWDLSSPYTRQLTLAAAASSLTFANIPTNLSSLRIDWTARAVDASPLVQEIRMNLDQDFGALYDTVYSQYTSAGASGATALNTTGGAIGLMPSSATTSSLFGSGTVNIPAWNGPHLSYVGWNFSTSLYINASNLWQRNGGGTLRNTAPYNNISFFPQAGNFAAGTQFTLIGLA